MAAVETVLMDFESPNTADIIKSMLEGESENISPEVQEMVEEVSSFFEEYKLLLAALEIRNIDQMRKSIREVEIRRIIEKLKIKYKAENPARQLQEALDTSKEIRAKYDDVEAMKKKIQKLKQSVISEIRSYGSPPEGIHQVMKATYTLLGRKKSEIKVRYFY